jgi:hypothetical protein
MRVTSKIALRKHVRLQAALLLLVIAVGALRHRTDRLLSPCSRQDWSEPATASVVFGQNPEAAGRLASRSTPGLALETEASAGASALAATHPVLPAIRATTHVEGKTIRSSRRPRRRAACWLRTTSDVGLDGLRPDTEERRRRCRLLQRNSAPCRRVSRPPAAPCPPKEQRVVADVVTSVTVAGVERKALRDRFAVAFRSRRVALVGRRRSRRRSSALLLRRRRRSRHQVRRTCGPPRRRWRRVCPRRRHMVRRSAMRRRSTPP